MRTSYFAPRPSPLKSLMLGLATLGLLLSAGAQATALSYFASFGGSTDDIGQYPVSPMAWGTYFSGTSADAHGLTVSGDSLYWLEDKNVWSQKTDGSGKTLLQTFGIAPIDLAVDAASGSYFASFGGSTDDIGKYPISPMAWGTFFTGTSADAHGMTVAGDKLFWLEDKNVWMENLDGSSKTLLQTFGISPVDLAVDFTSGYYFASFGGSTDDIGKYPLSPMAWGTFFAGTSSDAHGMTVADGKLYWLEDKNVWMEDLDGTNKTLLQTFGIAPLDLAVFDVPPTPDPEPPTGVPEPATAYLLVAALLGGGLVRRRVR
ncbi:MAG: hypothetical protein JWL63_2186 [Rhodocyclales bacterium]|nr:hypothetical protein [Rhodocyclales bacterium]